MTTITKRLVFRLTTSTQGAVLTALGSGALVILDSDTTNNVQGPIFGHLDSGLPIEIIIMPVADFIAQGSGGTSHYCRDYVSDSGSIRNDPRAFIVTKYGRKKPGTASVMGADSPVVYDSNLFTHVFFHSIGNSAFLFLPDKSDFIMRAVAKWFVPGSATSTQRSDLFKWNSLPSFIDQTVEIHD
jgi:hypothetical protein